MKYVVPAITAGPYGSIVCLCIDVCECVYARWRASLCLLAQSRVNPRSPGAPDIVFFRRPALALGGQRLT